MSRRTWTKEDFHITYGNPIITAFDDNNPIKDTKDIMYFYYDIDVLIKNKIIFNSRTFDFPKVHNLASYIDYIIDIKEEDMFLCEDFKDGGFQRKKLYTFIDLEDSFNMECEYFYKIEKEIMHVKQTNQLNFKRYEEYVITIGRHNNNKHGYSNGEDYGKSVFIKHLTKEDLLKLK